MVTYPDGTKIYTWPDPIADVALNGASVADRGVLEALVHPDGWGRVTLKKALGKEIKLWVDGFVRTFQYWGQVAVTPE